MVIRKEDVDEALADAAGIQQVAKDTIDDKVVIVQPTKRCKNPFCQTVLKNAYASCEERQMCQCVKTHDDRTSIGGPVVVEKEVVDTDATFIIPRRKRSVSSLAAPARTGSNKVTKCAVLESRYPKRLRLGHRIRFTEVMDHFEPRARARPAYASSQTRARRIQEATRRTRAADMVRKARVERRCRRVTTTVDNTASGGRYPPSIPSELNSVSSTTSSTAPATLQAEHARPPIEPPHTSTLLTEMQNAPLARTTPPIRAEQHNRDRRTSDKYFQGRRSNNLPEPPRPSQDNHQDEYQFGPQMQSLSVQSQTCLNDRSAHRPNIEQRRREFGQRASCVVNYPVDTFHRSYEDSWRLNARRHQYDDHGNRINPREARSITHSNFGFLAVQQEEQRHRYCRPIVPDAGAISYEHRGAYGESAVYLPPVDAIDATTHPTNTHHPSVSPSNPTLPRATSKRWKKHKAYQTMSVEIGSGSHEEIREAFRLAAASAADFLLRLDDGRNNCRWRPRRRNSTSSETSDDCEFLFVQGVTDRCVDDSAAIALNESLKSTADDDGDVEPCSPPQEITNGTILYQVWLLGP
ncbi:unnamed protein product [Phytophthora lilii]|uniref:Unnamed protein product n=1 Tax=Phytophthora lilii TaxID=2077276 RepID=A0A9W6UDC8_9STRA|nr:unnamed protein product [Phytophthora lilii]